MLFAYLTNYDGFKMLSIDLSNCFCQSIISEQITAQKKFKIKELVKYYGYSFHNNVV